MNRIASFSDDAVEKLFQNLKDVSPKYRFTEDRIFNAESGISTVQKSGKVYAKNGQKQVAVAISAERGQTIIQATSLLTFATTAKKMRLFFSQFLFTHPINFNLLTLHFLDL